MLTNLFSSFIIPILYILLTKFACSAKSAHSLFILHRGARDRGRHLQALRFIKHISIQHFFTNSPPGISSNIQRLRVAFDEDRLPDLYEDRLVLQDIHSVSSLLKMYFRELPNPVRIPPALLYDHNCLSTGVHLPPLRQVCRGGAIRRRFATSKASRRCVPIAASELQVLILTL